MKVQKKFTWARLGVSRTIYVYVPVSLEYTQEPLQGPPEHPQQTTGQMLHCKWPLSHMRRIQKHWNLKLFKSKLFKPIFDVWPSFIHINTWLRWHCSKPLPMSSSGNASFVWMRPNWKFKRSWSELWFWELSAKIKDCQCSITQWLHIEGKVCRWSLLTYSELPKLST